MLEAGLTRLFFCVCMTIAEKRLAANLNEILRAGLASAAFGKSSAVYGHIDENGHFVRKWLTRKMVITDKMGKNGHLSVKIQTFRTRIYGQMLQKDSFVRKSSS